MLLTGGLLGKTGGLSAENAYMLCSVCSDLRISEFVDRPNWVVSCYLPRIVDRIDVQHGVSAS